MPGNLKLVRRVNSDGEIEVLIETRGEGGYFVAAPSNASTHATGRPWQLLKGGFDSIATITSAERTELHRIIRLLDEMPPPAPRASTARAPHVDGDRPGDRLNTEGRDGFRRLLERHGWTLVHGRHAIDYYRRPGKALGISATVADPGHAGRTGTHATLKVFSSSTQFDSEGTYDLLGATAQLEHGGDISALARTLADRIERQTAKSEDVSERPRARGGRESTHDRRQLPR